MLLMVEKASLANCNLEVTAGKVPRAARVSIEEICNGEWTIGGKAVTTGDGNPFSADKE